jgi:2,4-dienoyl-CoA reductase-like NADH-dependent reductase (Old Yellow Enzyme family)
VKSKVQLYYLEGDSNMTGPLGAASMLFQPMTIGNGKITLDHRVVLAPLTRNRGTPLNTESTPEKPNRIWLPNDLMVEYYNQRSTKGGLIITEGVPPSLEVSIATI